MTFMKTCAALGLAAMMAGCATTDTASRNTPFETTPNAGGAALQAQTQPLNVRQIEVAVPETLKVSEANSYYPSGDIVWRGDAPGDRHAQVQAIFEEAMTRGTADMTTGTPVVLDVEVLRFHALTEKARYTVGGVHSIRFGLTLRDARTGEALGGQRVVRADLRGFGGQKAVDAERQGLTQKVRITEHLARVIETELEQRGGYANQRLGLVQAINNTF
ncbi:DUF6778 family protein [uncultured Roseobacter sp.]|uniref:DUF6778 family protein n=1 Tax=uncultured Roseobacter sp. TaxID=114847 RepID=UPI002627CE1F|nr:DUF6778 family protein [uncultured Roseobacter sp.]